MVNTILTDDERAAAYVNIDHFLRNNLDDTDYANFSRDLDKVFSVPLPAVVQVPKGWREFLLEIEWENARYNRYGDSEPYCVCCEAWQSEGHKPGCKFAAMLAAAPESPAQGEPLTLDEERELFRLREAVKGPEGFATWQEAATAERVRRVKAERELAELKAQPPQGEVRDAETELNCAEEVLDGYAAHLDMEETAFDCIGDYITAVCEALKRPARAIPAPWREAVKVAREEAWQEGFNAGELWHSELVDSWMTRGYGYPPEKPKNPHNTAIAKATKEQP